MAKFELNQRVKVLFVDKEPEYGILIRISDLYARPIYTVRVDAKYLNLLAGDDGLRAVEGRWLRHEDKKDDGSLIYKLRACQHGDFSLTAGDLHTCFDCGATRRKHEVEWAIPSIWREL